ncbi:MAG: hypothetical protein JNK05_39120 [Myxococcales bacterium]|nr:hypothetical protein [Myxococcales bacterium]
MSVSPELLHPTCVLLWYVFVAYDAIEDTFGEQEVRPTIVSLEISKFVSTHWFPTQQESSAISSMLGSISDDYAGECRNFMRREVRLHGANCDLIWCYCLAVSSKLAMLACPDHPRISELAQCHALACRVLQFASVTTSAENEDWMMLVESYQVVAGFERLWEIAKFHQKRLQ